MTTDQPRWPDQEPGPEGRYEGIGPEARWRGQKGDKGDPGQGMTLGAWHGFLVLAVLLAGLTGGAIFFGAHAISRVTVLAQSQCQSNAHLGTIPLPVKPPAGQQDPGKPLVRFIIDQRHAWYRADCPGRLAPPSPGLIHWAKVYRLNFS